MSTFFINNLSYNQGSNMGNNVKLLEKMRRKLIPNVITMNELNRLMISKGFV